MKNQLDPLDPLAHAKDTLLDLAVRFGPKLLVAIFIITVGVFAAGWVARAIDRGLHRIDLEPPVRQLLTRVARVLVVGLFAIMALQNLGVELLPLIAGLGVAGAGIALATQGVLSNMAAGLTIIFTKPYRVGEYIAIVGVEGQVEAITLFSTALTHPDRSRIIVPNRKVVGEILHNYGKIRQSEVQVGVAYDSDLPAALAAIRDLVRANPRVLTEPAPVIQVITLADSAVQIAIKPWVAVADYGEVAGELNLSLVEELRQRGIGIPYPQREVRLIASRDVP
jgi:small conductance mechanosensitive channel